MTVYQNETCRTKVLKLLPEQDALFYERIERLRTREITVERYQQETVDLLRDLEFSKEFACAIAAVRGRSAAEWLVRRHIGTCRYTVQIYGLAAGEVHPIHHHHNLISTQIILEGAIHLRAYERVRRNGDGQLLLRAVRNEILGPGGVFQVSEWKDNAHWFRAVNEAALIFSVDARGFEDKTFDTDTDTGTAFGRRYLEPVELDCNGLLVCEAIDKQDALRRFAYPLNRAQL